jgi:multiple sugar transport system permease protein
MSHRSVETRNLFKGLAFISPWFVGFGVFLFLPIVLSLYYSFCDYNIVQKPMFVGLANYRLLFHDAVFGRALEVTLYYAAISVPAGLGVSLGVAILLNRRIIGQPIFARWFFCRRWCQRSRRRFCGNGCLIRGWGSSTGR